METTTRQTDVLILGGGPAGMAAAITLAERLARAGCKKRILLAERMDKPGRKLLATGNGRCNLGNAGAFPEAYRTQSPRRLEQLFSTLPPKRLRAFFEDHGLLCSQEPDGRLYPYSYFSGTVLEVLRRELARLGVEELCGFAACGLTRDEAGFTVKSAEGEVIRAGLVLLAAGGKAAPALGSDGSGLALAESLGHRLTPLWPCLVAFTSPSPLCKGLKGVRAQAKASLWKKGRLVAEDTGEVQFTDYGLSGIPFFQLSLACGPLRPGEDCTAGIDLFPHRDKASLAAWLLRRGETGLTAGQALEGAVHWKLAQAVLKAAGVGAGAALGEQKAALLADTLKNLTFPVSGTLGWESCQVMGGGVSLDEVDGRTLESRLCPGLYLAGEVLDVAGLCGGFNLHWAFGSGLLAGQGLAAALTGEAPEREHTPRADASRKPRRSAKAPAKKKKR